MLTQEQREFFELFAIPPPPGVSGEGAQRFMQAYLRDPQRHARWQEHLQKRAAAAPPPPAAASAVPPAAAVPAGMLRPVRVAPTLSQPRSTASTSGAPSVEPFKFTGSGGEYFGIWIVNLLLSLVTFGIYSAWAKVRRMQYFYRHTELAGASFDYHGTGLVILKGRIIGLALFLAYSFSFDVSVMLGLITLVVLAVALPWLLRNSFRFRMRNSSYRGLRFRFVSGAPDAYAMFLGKPLLVLVTMYLTAPWYHQQLKLYQHGSTWFGKTKFDFSATVGQFYKEWLLVFVLSIAVVFVPFFWVMFGAVAELSRASAEAGTPPNPQLMAGAIFTAFMVMFLGMLAITPIFQARMQNLVWNHTTLGPHRFESKVSAWRLFGIQLTNLLLVLLTFGFYMPWAAVRLARYRVESVSLVAAGDLQDFVAHQEQDLGAAGEETAEMFDFDIAL